MTKWLITKAEDNFTSKTVKMFKSPREIGAILDKTRWTILQKIAEKPMFPAEIARELNLHEQKVYYHIKQLIKADLLDVAYEKEIRGAIAKYYSTSHKAFAIELNQKEKGTIFRTDVQVNETISRFFQEFSTNTKFNGLIVVGSPEAHGPHKTSARDGHYAIYLSMFIGQFLPPQDELYVKLDVEVRSQKIYDRNLILVGGPAVNLVTHDINSKMISPVFDNNIQGVAPEAMFGRGITSVKNDVFYSQNNAGIIFKTQNPFYPDKTIIGFAGQGRRGTKATILALILKGKEILANYSGGDFRKVVEGFDLDGDGIIDSVEIVE